MQKPKKKLLFLMIFFVCHLFIGGYLASPASHAMAPSSSVAAVDNQQVGPMISVMVLYTPAVESREGSAEGVRSALAEVVSTTNQTYENSKIDQRIHLVYAGRIDYEESNDIHKDLARLLDPDDPIMGRAHQLREKYSADIVVLLVEPFYYPPGKAGDTKRLDKSSDAAQAFAVVAARIRFDRRIDYFTFAHELGHVMGASHDKAEAGNGITPYSYSYGYVNKTARFRTVMALDHTCVSPEACPRIPYWSSPDIKVNGQRLGLSSADNRKTLNNTAPIVAKFRTLGTNESLDGFGRAVASGDFDGDGYDDLVVGAPREAPGSDPNSGYIFIYRGTPFGLAPWHGLDQAGIGSNEDDDRFGFSFASGDFNGDGKDDLAVGAPGEAPFSDPKSGYVFIFKGTENGLSPAYGLDQAGLGSNEDDDRFGWSLASGDFNRDGKDDLAVGAPGEAPFSDPKSGYVFIFRGQTGKLKPWIGLDQNSLGSNRTNDRFGASLATGDFNNDDFDDLAVGAPGKSIGGEPQAGWVYTFRGHSNGLNSWQSIGQDPLGWDEEGDNFGHSLTAGDLTGNGRAELVVGAVGESKGDQEQPGSGWAYVYKYNSSKNKLEAWTSVGQGSMGSDEAGDKFGQSMITADLNGDKRVDLVISASNESKGNQDNSGSGWVYVYKYNSSKKELEAWKHMGQGGLGSDEAGDRFGWALAAGDFNQDEKDDFAVGAPGEGPGNDPRSGYVFTYEGTAAGPHPVRGLQQEQ